MREEERRARAPAEKRGETNREPPPPPPPDAFKVRDVQSEDNAHTHLPTVGLPITSVRRSSLLPFLHVQSLPPSFPSLFDPSRGGDGGGGGVGFGFGIGFGVGVGVGVAVGFGVGFGVGVAVRARRRLVDRRTGGGREGGG